MKISGKLRLGNIVHAGVAAAALSLAVLPIAAHAQNANTNYQAPAGSDSDVAAQVKTALQSDQALDSRHIDVSVEHGDVVLKGFVQDNHALLDATQVATKAAGGRKVVNKITIKQNYPNAP